MRAAVRYFKDITGLTRREHYRRRLNQIKQGICYTNRDLFGRIEGPILFIHIPKAAGMSFIKALYNKERSLHATALDYRTVDPERFANSFCFAVTRNPYQRLISAYYYLHKGGKEIIDEVWRDLYLKPYKDINDFVINGLEKAILENAEHFIPQYRFVTDESGQIICDYVGQLENLDEVAQVLAQQGKILSLPKENTNSHAQTDVASTLSPEAIDTINRLYQQDFSLFNYPLLSITPSD